MKKKKKKNKLIQITSPYFCAGVVLKNNVCIKAAPIVKYMKYKKWNTEQITDYCRWKKWKIKNV